MLVTQIVSARAQIQEPVTLDDTQIETWSVSDRLGNFSQGFDVTTRVLGQLRRGNEVTIYAGYEGSRIKLITGVIETTGKGRRHGDDTFNANGRNAGAKEYSSVPITRVWESTPPTITPLAHDIVREASAAIGLSVGVLEFPNYPLYNSFNAVGKTIVQIVQELLEPWNQFKRVEHVGIIRDHELSVIKIDWANPPDTGYVVAQRFHSDQQINEEDYLDSPRLNEVSDILVRGATWTRQKDDIGQEIFIEYNNQHVDRQIIEEKAGTYGQFVQMEIESTTIVEQGKVLTRVETQYRSITNQQTGNVSGWNIHQRITEENIYFIPNSAIRGQEAFNIPTLAEALLAATVTVREGWDTSEVDEGVFQEVERTITELFYNENDEVTVEVSTSQARNQETGAWEPSTVEVRTHSKTTSGTVRTQLTIVSVDNEQANANLKLLTQSVSRQSTGGEKPSLNNPSARGDLISRQEQYPPALTDSDGNPIDQGDGRLTWTYENAYLGPQEVQKIYEDAVAERAFQAKNPGWERIPFQSSMNPNLYAGMPVRIEIAEDVFQSYWVEDVRHSWTPTLATTSGMAARLTDVFAEEIINTITLNAPTNLTATAVSTSQIDLAWTDNSSIEDGFSIERSPNGVTGWTEIATVGANITVYSDTGLASSTTYFYRVRAFLIT